jgi:hypothetical protein
MKFRNLIHTLITLIACTGFLPQTEAVNPPPDGGYPGFNTAEGTKALQNLSSGVANTGLGWYSLFSDTAGSYNTGVGAGTLALNTGDENTATGAGALLSNMGGVANTANGIFALVSNTVGTSNTAIGNRALSNNTTGSGNVALGVGAGNGVTTATSVICIRHQGANIDSSCFIENIRGVETNFADTLPVLVDSFGQLGTASSSRRSKKEIRPMDKTSEAILALKPVTFRFKSDAAGIPQFGLIAEEVAEVNPDLIVRDKNGEVYTVRYDAVNAMLLNEFLKEHSKVQQLEATVAQQRNDFETTITELKKEMKRVAARFEEQDAKIQKVSAQIELNEAEAETVAQR